LTHPSIAHWNRQLQVSYYCFCFLVLAALSLKRPDDEMIIAFGCQYIDQLTAVAMAPGVGGIPIALDSEVFSQHQRAIESESISSCPHNLT
jgi:hypothetical protein